MKERWMASYSKDLRRGQRWKLTTHPSRSVLWGIAEFRSLLSQMNGYCSWLQVSPGVMDQAGFVYCRIVAAIWIWKSAQSSLVSCVDCKLMKETEKQNCSSDPFLWQLRGTREKGPGLNYTVVLPCSPWMSGTLELRSVSCFILLCLPSFLLIAGKLSLTLKMRTDC